ncbi:MAG TPA: carotenoid oxygenase family protein [Pseudonocardiaceae bacterium]|nr:carotenoid oxygenase family protein [Pseudonocardiaceae bacterium]
MGNHYLAGNYAPVPAEYTITELAVTGTIPAHLDGRYVRNGPNPIADVDPQTYHWFTGDGMVHGVRLRDGKAQWYRNRWIRTPAVARRLGEASPRSAPIRMGLELLGANTNVVSHAGRTLALVEGGITNYELTEDLGTAGPCDFDGTVRGGYTAHPKCDPDTGELHAVSYSFGRGNRVQYSVIGVDGTARRTVDVEVTGSPMMHDFSLTRDHVVFYDLPVIFDSRQAASISVPRGLRVLTRLVLSALIGRVRVPEPVVAMVGRRMGGNAGLPYRWNPDYPARVGVMPRTGGADDVRWFAVEPCYVFHAVNAYDDGDTIIADVVRHPKMFASDFHGPNEGPTTLDRWVIDLADGKVRETRLDDHPQEFPRADDRLAGHPYRYGYAMQTSDAGGDAGDSVLKHDLRRGITTARRLGTHQRVGEFVFVPAAAQAAEDEGVLMGFIYDVATNRSDLVILDAATLETVAAIHLPHRVPFGFHGNWLPADH